MSGPRRRTLQEHAAACADGSLFSPLADGRVILTASRRRLEDHLSISRGSLWRRIRTLTEAGLATDDGQLVVDVEAINERLVPRVVALPTRRTRQYQAVLEQTFETSVAADGTHSFHHADGRPATLSDIAAATGASSRGTAHRHIQRLRTTDDSLDGALLDEQLVESAKTAIDSLAILGAAATRAQHTELATTAFAALDEIAIALAGRLPDDVSSNVAVAARSKARHGAALRAAKRDTSATLAPSVSLQNEYENDSSHTHDATPRAAKRDAAATSNDAEAIAAADRAFTGLPDWDAEDWDQLTAPLATAWAERTGKNLRIDGYCRDAALAWPKAYVRRAIAALIDDLNSGRNIKNPGGLLAISAREGRLHYFPTAPPQAAADPELERSRFLGDSRARALDRLARGNDAAGLANAVVELATVKGQADPEALAEMVDAIRAETAEPGARREFDEQILSLLTTKLAWSHSGLSTINDLTALFCE